MYKGHPRLILLTVFTCLTLFLCACSGTLKETPVQPDAQADLTLTASFQRQDGSAVREMQAGFCCGQMQVTSPLDEQGRASFSHVPRDGEAALTLRDDDGEASRISLRFVTASVTDASTDADGVGHISVKADTAQLHLLLTLDDDEQLQCSLYLNDLQP